MDWAAVRKDLTAHGQDHLLRHLEELTCEEKQCLYDDITELNLPRLATIWDQTLVTRSKSCQIKDDKLQPLDSSIVGSTVRDKDRLDAWRDIGLDRVGDNQVAVLLLAGGQGTRLNVSYPKGMYDVGLPSGKSLYQLQAERILRLQTLAEHKSGKPCVISWYIMTSEHTMAPTEQFFKDHSYFGLQADNVRIFEQNTLPCLDFTGKILLSSKHRIARAPDGNGGLYTALANNTVLSEMRGRGVTCVHVYCVDNILVRMADPVFVGFCFDKGAECGAKVVKKVQPTERVGVVCRYDDHYEVVEYSEVSSRVAEMRDSDGTLTYDAGNIANHFFTLDFLERICREHADDLCHHVANKKIVYVSESGERVEPTEPNGIKLEKFIFDVFAFAKSFSVLEVLRGAEFSPVKNAPGAAKDTPATAREDLCRNHHRWLLEAGGRVSSDQEQEMLGDNGLGSVCEVSPLVSYCGEGLEKLVAGKTFTAPVHLESKN